MIDALEAGTAAVGDVANTAATQDALAAMKADALGMLRDSLLVASFLDDKDQARHTFARTARWIAGLA